MRAAVLRTIKEPVEIEDVEQPSLQPDSILLRMKAGALNHRDIFIQQGLYAKIQVPCILGSDGVGVVESMGTDIEGDLMGMRVLIFPSVAWGESERVQGKEFRVLGMPDSGTFAQFKLTKQEDLFPVPEHLEDREAAALPLAGLTAYRALFKRGGLKKEQRVLITGIGGGVAITAFQFAVAAGTEVWVTSSDPSKIESVREWGGQGGVNYKDAGWHKELKSTAGVFDLIIDSAGGDGFAHLLDVAKPGGTIVSYGGTQGPVNDFSPQKLYWKQLDIRGTTMGSRTDFQEMLDFVSKHQILPIVDRSFPLRETQKAMDYLASGAQQGKVVIMIGE